MSKIRLHGSSSGYVEIAPAAAASNNTLTAPSTVGEIIAKDAAGAIGVTSVHTTNITATGIATITTAKIGAGVTISESGIEASGIGITCANINGTQIGGRRNLVINGAMTVAQRGTSSTSNGYQTVDRYNMNSSGHDEAPTQSQADVSSGTSPYAEGFRKSLKITNGNQTSGAGAADRLRILYIIEAQDMANSGWNYTDSNSKVTLSFWIKSSVAQNFYFRATTSDGTSQNFPMETGALTANTWTKITKTIPGNSNLQFDNNNGIGFYLIFALMRGTDNTDSGVALNTWAATSSGVTLYPDFTTTWWTTNDATWEMTGLQLELGSQVTPFEHRSYNEELSLCHRYFQTTATQGYYLGTDTSSTVMGTECGNVFGNSGDDNASGLVWFGGVMRTAPTVTLYKRNSTTTGEIEQNGVGRTAAAASISAKGCEYINITGGNATAAVPACCAYTCSAEL